MRAVVLDRLAAERGADDLDVLARAAERLAVRDAVPALDDLRPRGAEAEEEAAARELVERRDRHRRHRGRARRHLHDRGADPDLLGGRGDPARHRDRVRAPGLRRPDGVEAEPVGVLRHRDRRRSGRRSRAASRASSPADPMRDTSASGPDGDWPRTCPRGRLGHRVARTVDGQSCGTMPSAPSTRGPGTFGNLNLSGSRPGWQTHAWPVSSLRAASSAACGDLLRLHQREAGRVELGLRGLGHRRPHDPGADQVDPDPARLEHRRHRARVADDRVLGQHVERIRLHRDQPGERRGDDEDAALAASAASSAWTPKTTPSTLTPRMRR